MNRKLWALAFFLCTVSLPTYAADWVLIGRNTGGNIIFVDKSSLQRDGDSVTFWYRTNYNERELGNLSNKMQLTINCRRREMIVRYMMTYDDIDNRGHLTNSFVPKKQNWRPIPPETTLSEMMVFVCSK